MSFVLNLVFNNIDLFIYEYVDEMLENTCRCSFFNMSSHLRFASEK